MNCKEEVNDDTTKTGEDNNNNNNNARYDNTMKQEVINTSSLNNNINNNKTNNSSSNTNTNTNVNVVEQQQQQSISSEILNTINTIPEMYLTSQEDKNELERIRRWKIKIEEFQLSPTPTIFDCFIEIIIGGNYKVYSYHNTSKRKSTLKRSGHKRICFFTECKETNITTSTIYSNSYAIELRDSIINLMRQNLILQLWEYNTWLPNTSRGTGMISLFDIIKGSIYRNITIQGVKVSFKIVFQELWDFELSFEDWSLTNIKQLFGVDDTTNNNNSGYSSSNSNSKLIRPTITFEMNSIKQKVISLHPKTCTNNPIWSNFNKNIIYRGTLNDLENEKISVIIEQNSSFIDNKTLQRSIGLKGITISNFITQTIPRDKRKLKTKFKHRNNTSSRRKTLKDITNDILSYEDSILNGKININNIPQYRQSGFDSTISESDAYICIYIKDLSSSDIPIFVKKPLNVFITIEYGGKQYETKRVRLLPNTQVVFNTEINFLFGIDCKHIKDDDSLYNAILTELDNINVIDVMLWVEDYYNTLTYLGKFNIVLTDVFDKGRFIEDKQYKNAKNDIVRYTPKIYVGNDKFKSGYRYNELAINYQVWFFPEKISRVEISKEKLKKKSKTNPLILQCEYISKQLYTNIEHIKEELLNKYNEIQIRFYDLMQIQSDNVYYNEDVIKEIQSLPFFVIDQNGIHRFMPSYLSKLTLDEVFYDRTLLMNEDIGEIFKHKVYLDTIEFPLISEKGLLYYVQRQRWNSLEHDFILLSPDYFMMTKQGTKYEHAVVLACLMMSYYSNKHQLQDKTLCDMYINKAIINELKLFMKVNELWLDNYNELKAKYGEYVDMKESDVDKKIKKLKKKNMLHYSNGNKCSCCYVKYEELMYKRVRIEENKLRERYVEQIGERLKRECSFDSEDLVFVCMGTLKVNSGKERFHFWVMAFSEDLKDVSFYEPMTCKIYRLKNRVKYPEVLWLYLRGGFMDVNEVNKVVEGYEKEIKEEMGMDVNVSGEMNKDNDNEDKMKRLQNVNNEDTIDEVDYIEYMKKCFMNDNEQITTSENNNIHNNIKEQQQLYDNDNNDKDEDKENGTPYKNNNPSYNKIKTKEHFILKNEELKKLKNEVLPYRTIDAIFNKKNIFINLQNPNPACIHYDIYDITKWHPFLLTEFKNTKRQNRHPPQHTTNTTTTNNNNTSLNVNMIWKETIPPFYSFKNCKNPYTIDEIDKMKKEIVFEFQKTIRSIRNQKGLNSFFKTSREIKEILELYLIFQEMYQVGLLSNIDNRNRMDDWSYYFVEKMHNMTKYYFLPLCFSYSHDIQNSLFDFQEFLFKNLKDGFIHVVCKIFQYPNQVLSIRVLIVLCCKCQEDTNMSGNEFYQMTSPCDEESEEYSDSEGNDDIKESIKDRNDNSECCSSGSVSRNKKDNGSNRDINNVSSVSNVSSVRGSDLEGETLLKSTFNKENTLLNNTSTTTNNNISTRRIKKIIKRYKKS